MFGDVPYDASLIMLVKMLSVLSAFIRAESGMALLRLPTCWVTPLFLLPFLVANCGVLIFIVFR